MSRPGSAGLLFGPLAALAGAGLIYLLVALTDEPAIPELPMRESPAVQAPPPLIRAPVAPRVRAQQTAPVPQTMPGISPSAAPIGPAHAVVRPQPVGEGALLLEDPPDPLLETDRRRGRPVLPAHLRRTNQRPGGQPVER